MVVAYSFLIKPSLIIIRAAQCSAELIILLFQINRILEQLKSIVYTRGLQITARGPTPARQAFQTGPLSLLIFFQYYSESKKSCTCNYFNI
jgi:hypothetical protein